LAQVLEDQAELREGDPGIGGEDVSTKARTAHQHSQHAQQLIVVDLIDRSVRSVTTALPAAAHQRSQACT
jgi:hypothetical protein